MEVGMSDGYNGVPFSLSRWSSPTIGVWGPSYWSFSFWSFFCRFGRRCWCASWCRLRWASVEGHTSRFFSLRPLDGGFRVDVAFKPVLLHLRQSFDIEDV